MQRSNAVLDIFLLLCCALLAVLVPTVVTVMVSVMVITVCNKDVIDAADDSNELKSKKTQHYTVLSTVQFIMQFTAHSVT